MALPQTHPKAGDSGKLLCCAPAPAPSKETIPRVVRAEDVLQFALSLDDDGLIAVCERVLLSRARILERLVERSVFDAFRTSLRTEIEASLRSEIQMQVKEANSSGFNAADSKDADLGIGVNAQRHGPGNSDGDENTDATQEDHRDALLARFEARDRKLYGEAPPMPPIVQFEASMFFCSEDAGTVELGIMRIGDITRPSVVRYQTRDGSAKAGKKYVAQSAELVFAADERVKKIELQMIDDTAWDATLEFQVVLLEDGLKNAELGRYLHSCRIKIMDDDSFPTNKFAPMIRKSNLSSVPKPSLLVEYMRMNLRNEFVRRGTIKTVISDVLVNVYFVMCLFLNLYLVDFVVCEQCSLSEAPTQLALVVILRLAPFPLIHYLEYRRTFWLVAGVSRMTLQSNLLRKYLHYDEDSRSKVDESRLIMSMSRDASELVEKGYCKLMPLIRAFCRLLMLLAYQIVIPQVRSSGIAISWRTYVEQLSPTIIFPLLMFTWLRIRNPRTLKYLETSKGLQNEMLAHIRHTMANYALIRDYKRRAYYVDEYEKKIRRYNVAWVDTESRIANDRQFAPWITLIVIASYIYIGGLRVSNGSISLGEFLNNLATYEAMGAMFVEIYEILLDMQNTFDALNTMVENLNLPTDVPHRMEAAKRNYSLCHEGLLRKSRGPRDPADELCIELRDLTFRYRTRGTISSELKRSTACLPQGGLYTLVGPPSEGKGTVLRLMGEVLLPYVPNVSRDSESGSGDLMIPTHLRALHVMRDPMFVQGTLLHNLTFGCAAGTDDDRIERVIEILKMLKLPDALIRTVQMNDLSCNWLEVLASTDMSLLHVARALIANPEFLCIHKPALFLNTEMGDNCYSVLKAFVEHRGLAQEASKFYQRRPRTCVVTARRVEGAGSAIADAVFHVSQQSGMQLLDLSSLQKRGS